MDLYHRKRRKSPERRARNRTLAEDYRAFMAAEAERETKLEPEQS